MMSTLLVVVLTALAWQAAQALLPTNRNGPSIAMTFIVRDEEVNVRSNLPDYVAFVDYFVFMVDHRTSDGTLTAIEEILGGKRNYHIEMYEFDGFGPARTASLQTVWKHYSNATHVWIADPDWKADMKSIKKEELSMDADAFRFLIYDRNGFTTRRCDWLLRNRANLAMRYHLHEVLDIGETYVWKEISWIVHEIEQKGSWHNKVGHTSSHASKRYIFDLKYLEKDLEIYDRDAHTDYYIGVTHHAYVDAYSKENSGTNIDVHAILPSGRSVVEHMELAIKYLTLRATFNYEREFIEERWGVMFLLGTIHGFMTTSFNLAESEKWFSMCRDYNPGQMECSINLINLYLNAGLYDKMMKEYLSLMKTPYEERTMMNHYSLKACSIPAMAVSVLAVSDDVQKSKSVFNAAVVKFMHALALSLDTEMCSNHDPSIFERSMEHVAKVMSNNGDFFRRGYASLESVCADSELQSYLATSAIVHHPCEKFTQQLEVAKFCADFSTDLVPPHDIRQILQTGEFIGAANLYDIVHHVYAGDSGRVFAKSGNSPYRILFAQYFNPKNIYTLLKQLMDHSDGNKVEIYVLPSRPTVKDGIQQHIDYCLSNSAAFSSRKSMKNDGITFLTSLPEAQVKFDYIEYNGGMSRSIEYKGDLEYLQSFLTQGGVMGITAFSQNKHTKEIMRLIQERDPLAHIPFSSEPFRMAREYLSAAGYATRSKKDLDLSYFLSSNTSSRVYTKAKLISDLEDSGLSIISFASSGQVSPFDDFSHQMVVQKWKSLGMTEADFVEEFVVPFRYTVYAAAKTGAGLPGRPDLIRDSFPANTVFMDRSFGSLGEVFSGLQSQPGSFEALRVPLFFQVKMNSDVSVLRNDEDKTLSLYLAPDAVAGLSLLPSSPTLQDMVNTNTALRPATRSRSDTIGSLLLQNMVDFEKLNFISVWIPHGAAQELPSSTQEFSRDVSHEDERIAVLLREHELKRQEKVSAMKAMGFGQGVIDVALAADDAEFKSTLASKVEDKHDISQAQPSLNTHTRGIKQITKKSKASTVAPSKVKTEVSTNALGIAEPVGGGTLIKKSDGSAVYLGGGVTIGVRGANGNMVMVTGGSVPAIETQSKQQLESSFRKPNCQHQQESKQCPRSGLQVRPTADAMVTTLSKLEFDLRQLRYIAFEYPTSANTAIGESLLFAYQQLIDIVKARVSKEGKSSTDLIRLTNEEISMSKGYVNALVHLTKEPVLKSGALVCHQGALNKMVDLAEGLLENDFAVMDALMESRPLRVLTSMLLGSTVWYDVGNGNAFFSHNNDGLVFNIASQFGKELASSLGAGYKVNKYSAVAFDLSRGGQSAMFYGMNNEYYAVIWLNSFAAPATAEDDGLLVYGDGTGACLQNSGGTVDSTAHRDFVSVNGKLAANVRDLCPGVDSEMVPRKHNRLTLVAPNRAFVFSSPGEEPLAKKTFDTKTVVALVVSLSPAAAPPK